MLTQILFWTVLILFLSWGVYALRAIRQERGHFKNYTNSFHLLYFKLYIPSWWRMVVHDQELPAVRFVRRGRKYDWYAYFAWKANPEKKSLKLLAGNWMKSEGIIADEDHVVTESTEREHTEDYFRLEGTATQNESERIYIDLCLIKDTRFEQYFLAQNKSSILCGSLESAYFEKVLSHLEILHEETL